MPSIVVTMILALLVGLFVVSFFALPTMRAAQDADPEEVTNSQINLAPWEMDQRLPVVPAAVTTQSIPIVPIPSAQELTADDVPTEYPGTGRGTHRWAREFGLPLKWPGPRHAR